MKALTIALIIILPLVGLANVDSLNSMDTTVLEIKDGKTIFGSESDWWDKYSGGLIAMVTIFVSLGISVWQARKTTKENRANSISEARIRWVNDLRPLMSELIVLASHVRDFMHDTGKLYDPETESLRKNLTPLENKTLNDLVENWKAVKPKFDSTFNQIKLFLNPNEPEHKEYIDSVNTFIDNARSKVNGTKIVKKVNEKDLIKKGQIVLKTAWEQAKNEGKKSAKTMK